MYHERHTRMRAAHRPGGVHLRRTWYVCRIMTAANHDGGRPMVATRYSLDEFIHDMTALLATAPDQAALFDRGSAYIERLVRDPEAIPEEYRRPAINGRRPGGGSYCLYRGPGLL